MPIMLWGWSWENLSRCYLWDQLLVGGDCAVLRSSLPTTPTYDNYKFNPIFIPREDNSKYAGYIICWSWSHLYALDMYHNTDWIDLWTTWNSNFWYDCMSINVATWSQLVFRQGQRTNAYWIYNINWTSPTYSTVTANWLTTNTYSDMSYINTYSWAFLQKDWNISGSTSSAAWKRYNWSTKTVIASWNLPTSMQSARCADDIVNPNFLYRWGWSSYNDRTTDVYKFDLSTNTVTKIWNLSWNIAINQPFYYNWFMFCPTKSNFDATTTQAYKYNLSNNTCTTVNLWQTLDWYLTRKQFYIDKYLYIFPSWAQGIVIDMSTL